jgi:hypothetical protein
LDNTLKYHRFLPYPHLFTVHDGHPISFAFIQPLQWLYIGADVLICRDTHTNSAVCCHWEDRVTAHFSSGSRWIKPNKWTHCIPLRSPVCTASSTTLYTHRENLKWRCMSQDTHYIAKYRI